MSVVRATQPQDARRPVVLVLYFLRDNYLQTTERQLYDGLRQHSDLLEARDTEEALQHLSLSPPPKAVLVADASITEAAHADFLEALVEYARAGGRVVFGVRFGAHFPYFEVSPFFRRFGMLWDRGMLSNSTFVLNTNGVPNPLFEEHLLPTLSAKAQQIKDVGTGFAVYVSPSGPSNAPVKTSEGIPYLDVEIPAAFAPLAGGYVGYAGNLSGGPESTKLLLEMCGVAEATDGTGSEITAGGAYIHPDGSGPAGCPRPSLEKSASPYLLEDQPRAPQSSGPLGLSKAVEEEAVIEDSPPQRPSVLILKLRKDLPIRITHAQVLNGLEENTDVHVLKDGPTFLKHLQSSPPPRAVLVADNLICGPKYADLLRKLIEYAKSGGRVVLGAAFSESLDYRRMETFFRPWGVSWSMGFPDCLEKPYALNPRGVPKPLSPSALFPAFFAATNLIYTSAPGEVVYGRVTPGDRSKNQGRPYSVGLDTAAAAWARVGKGFLGYVGDIDWEQALARLTLEMCGVAVAPGDLGIRTYLEDFESAIQEPEIPLPPPGRTRQVEVVLRARQRAETRAEKLKKGEKHKNEGNAKFKAGDYLGAAKSYRSAVVADCPRPVYMANMAAALLKLERWDIAQSAASRALYHEPTHAKARFRRAIARKHLKRYNAAKLDLQKFLFLDRTKMNEEGFHEFEILDELEKRGDEVDWPIHHSEAGPEEVEDAFEVDEQSDSEDFKHHGSESEAAPCRGYNHDGCSKGSKCPLKHSPTGIYTIRDELGRNVCLFWLLDTCEQGDACAYAHDKTYLPPSGWWTNTTRLERIRAHTERMSALAGRPYPATLLIQYMHPKPWCYESWALVPFAPTTEARKALERRGDLPLYSYVWDEMRFYGIDRDDPDAYDQLELHRRLDDNA